MLIGLIGKPSCGKSTFFKACTLADVLIAGASEGKGLGNEFLNDLSTANAFIHIVDISGETDAEGKETQGYNPVNDIEMLEKELDLWYLGILKKVWKSFARVVQNTKGDFAKAVANQFSGLNVREIDVKKIVLIKKLNSEKPNEWDDNELLRFAHELRYLTKPMIIAANKCDRPESKKNLDKLKTAYPNLNIFQEKIILR